MGFWPSTSTVYERASANFGRTSNALEQNAGKRIIMLAVKLTLAEAGEREHALAIDVQLK